MTSSAETSKSQSVAFLLVPNYSMIAFSAALEPLRMANQTSGKELYRWQIVTYDGQPVAASNGLELRPDGAAHDVGRTDLLFVCGGNGIENTADPGLPSWLRRRHRLGLAVGGVCTGSYLLAAAGLLDGVQCTIHWEYIASMRERFPRVPIREEIFVIERGTYTCAGGNAPLDMMLHLIHQRHGRALAAAISEEFLLDHMRDERDHQRIPLRSRPGAHNAKLLATITLMEANVEEPFALDELATHVGLSRRQLERLFHKHLNCAPTRYYMEVRLRRARQLLMQTNLSIAEIAAACGFVSAPHFSRCFREQFSLAPREERMRGEAGGHVRRKPGSR